MVLTVSGSREMQWCVYPTSQDGSLTNWSHELPAATWWHVAVVNDSQHTTMYVDGRPVVRNPTTPNRGLASAGRSWLVGANHYGGDNLRIYPVKVDDAGVVWVDAREAPVGRVERHLGRVREPLAAAVADDDVAAHAQCEPFHGDVEREVEAVHRCRGQCGLALLRHRRSL